MTPLLQGPDSGMAFAIGVVMIGMLAVPGLLLGAVGWMVTPKDPRWARWVGLALGLVAGPLLGLVLVKVSFDLPWSFFTEMAWPSPPPPALVIVVPPACERDWLVLVEDPGASAALEDQAPDPGMLQIEAPASGFLRVRSIAPVLRAAPITARRPEGEVFVGLMPDERPLPPGARGTRWAEVFIGAEGRFPATAQSLEGLSPEELAARLRALEEAAPR